MQNFAEHITLLMGVCTFIGGLIALYGAAVRKQYASERDFNHLKRNYESLSGNIASIDRMIDDRLDKNDMQLVEIKVLILALVALSEGSASNILERKTD